MNTATTTPVPAHVPPDLVRIWDLNGVGMKYDIVPYEAIHELHRSFPPAFYSPLPGYKRDGAWYFTKARDICEILLNDYAFSCNDIVGFSSLAGESFPLIPTEIDPPDHGKYRQLFTSFLAPGVVARMADNLRERAAGRIALLAEQGGCDFMAEFGRPYPILVVFELMDLPPDSMELFVGWVNNLLHGTTMADRGQGARSIINHLRGLIAERRKNPGEDLVSTFATATIDGRPLTDDESLGLTFLSFSGGLDTVAASLGFHYWYLATRPDLQRQLRDFPELIPHAVEELLRMFSLVTFTRRVVKEVEIGGVKMMPGDVALGHGAFAGFDPEAVESPEDFRLNRSIQRNHLAFSTGRHICLGQHLARLELRIALEEWLKRIPEFRVAEGTKPVAHAGGVFGMDELHLRWD